ncbi:MAG: Mth938-like domain-containing protein [Sterolibacterium sp.]|nr:Mth938-like domain-containing protein [Sterolibacterium sp.]
MKLHRDLNIGQNLVTAYGPDYIDVNGQRHETGLILLPRQIHAPWGMAGFDALTAEDFRYVVTQECEILFLGTGRQQRFPQAALLRELITARIGIEIMDTGAACRTFNILVAEGRNVAAALLLEK